MIAGGAAYLQVTLYAFPWPQTWLRSLTTIACAASVFFLYVLYYIVRAPWKLYPFSRLEAGKQNIGGHRVQVKEAYRKDALKAINDLVDRL